MGLALARMEQRRHRVEELFRPDGSDGSERPERPEVTHVG
jgi:hypothetical protein